jgi:hypothetical protein
VNGCAASPSRKHGSEKTELTVALDGAAVLLDLCEEDAATIREAVQEIIDHSRPIAVKDLAKRGNDGSGVPADPAVVRQWLTEHGHTVSNRGRIPENLVEIWRNATQA